MVTSTKYMSRKFLFLRCKCRGVISTPLGRLHGEQSRGTHAHTYTHTHTHTYVHGVHVSAFAMCVWARGGACMCERMHVRVLRAHARAGACTCERMHVRAHACAGAVHVRAHACVSLESQPRKPTLCRGRSPPR